MLPDDFKNSAPAVIDINWFEEIYRASRNKRPKSSVEENLRAWTPVDPQKPPSEDLLSNPDILNNIALVTAAISRRVSGERLIKVESSSDALTLVFDCIQGNTPDIFEFDIHISR